MKKMYAIGVTLVLPILLGAPALARPTTRVVTSSNNPAGNQLLVYDSTGALVQTVSTGGLGGVAGNAGGIAVSEDTLAVVNFGSGSVSVFDIGQTSLTLRQTIATLSNPVSVAFGKD